MPTGSTGCRVRRGSAVPDRLLDDPTIPPPGRRNGVGSASILPYLVKTLAAKPMAPASLPPSPPARSEGDEAPRQGRHAQ